MGIEEVEETELFRRWDRRAFPGSLDHAILKGTIKAKAGERCSRSGAGTQDRRTHDGF